MRHTEKPSNPLGQIIWHFRGKYHLSKRDAARVLGVSYVYVNSLEAGVDVKTGLPFRPREATLRLLASKMTEHGYPVTFEELSLAAGFPLAGIGNQVTDEPTPPPPMVKKIEGTLEVPADAPEPPDEWELDVLRKTGALGSRDYSKESDFWYLPREDRRALLRHLEDIWFEDQRLRKKMAERSGGRA